jgi:hypothetical protein
MAKQIKHVRVSKNGKPFRAGSKKVPVELPKPSGFCRITITPLSRAFFSFLKDWSEEVTLEFIKGKGLRVFGMDPANVALIDYTFSCDVFDSFKKVCQSKDLFSAIRKARRNDVLDFLYEYVSVNIEHVIIKNLMQNYSDKIIVYDEKEEKDLKIPALEKANYSMVDWQGSVLFDVIYKASKSPKAGESIVFHGYEGRMVYAVPLDTNFANDKGEVEMATTGTVKGLTKEFPKEVVKAKYSIPYLMKIARVLKYWPPQDKLTLKFGTDYPLIIIDTNSYFDNAFFREKSTKGKFIFILAPRIEQD